MFTKVYFDVFKASQNFRVLSIGNRGTFFSVNLTIKDDTDLQFHEKLSVFKQILYKAMDTECMVVVGGLDPGYVSYRKHKRRGPKV